MDYNKIDYNTFIQETISKQITDEYYIHYYYSNCYGDPITTFTLYKGDIRIPEYSEEVFHGINGDKRYTEKQVVKHGLELVEKILPIIHKDIRR